MSEDARRLDLTSQESAAINGIVAEIRAKLEISIQTQNALFASALRVHEAEKVARGEMRRSNSGQDAAFFGIARALRRLGEDIQARHRHEVTR